MLDYLYPTQADGGIEWVENMLINWRSSHQQLQRPGWTGALHLRHLAVVWASTLRQTLRTL